ncbi:MAG: ABC transporter ATPase [Candidatus Arcticimaribacter sp.]|nr:ABC transporter ATPase [Flavobacteriaceae bacterium]MDB9910816.1 ABC transporter ATPase [Flavobacteriaceae bacterium]PSR09918.1 MAG: ABC transporter ATPase [Candidatus Arcticimaribacter sp.]PTL99687.1 MAG: ABC transporter ATPase [Candidatus Arcticimaribacter sp.]
MLIPFTDLPDQARVWIYQASRPFSKEEKTDVILEIEAFLKLWAAHGSDLVTSYEIPYDRFIVIGLNEEVQGATGCSIDSSVRFIQTLETKYQIELLDKMNVTHKEGDKLLYTPLKEFRSLAKKRKVSSNTIVFNNLVVDKAEYTSHWEVPAGQSWHSRFIK